MQPREAADPVPEGADRRARLRRGLKLKGTRGIEIGPLANPLVQKSEADIRYVDWADRATLAAKYSNDPNVDIARIVDIDVIWGERTLAECFGDERNFDYVIASHVLEHVPDLVGWLDEIAEVLRPDGRLILAVPDRRFTFDFFRRTSSLADVIGAYLNGNRKPNFAQIFDQGAYWSRVNLREAWERPPRATDNLSIARLREAFEVATAVARSPQYLDVHCWVFTPRSLLEIFIALLDLDLLSFRCAEFRETCRFELEMQMVLEKVDASDPAIRDEARQSFLDSLHRLAARAETDEPWLGTALARRDQPEGASLPRWEPSSQHWREHRLVRRLKDALHGFRRRSATTAAPAVIATPRPIPPVEALGHDFSYQPTFAFSGPYIDGDHRTIAHLPSDGLIRIQPPGYIRPADALALYEHAYFAHGDALELGSAWGLSTLFLCRAVLNTGGDRQVVSLEADANLHQATRRTIGEYGLGHGYRGICGDVIQAIDRFIVDHTRFGMVFVDFSQNHTEVHACCMRLSNLLYPGAMALIHDFNDACNVRGAGSIGVYWAVVEALTEAPDLEFLGTIGCCGLVRKRP